MDQLSPYTNYGALPVVGSLLDCDWNIDLTTFDDGLIVIRLVRRARMGRASKSRWVEEETSVWICMGCLLTAR